MKRQFLLILFCVTFCLQALHAQAAASLTNEQKNWLTKANRHEKSGWIYLHIEGGPKERGFQYGYLLAREIKEAIRVLSEDWKYQTAIDWSWFVRKAGEILTAKVDSENITEINGMVEGMSNADVSTTRNELVALNGYIELMWYWWPSVKDSIKDNSRFPIRESCSSFIATGSMTADGKIVLGHNSMVGYQSPFCNIILDILPEQGHRIIMQAFTGFIHSGTDFFVTDAGLVGSETTIGGFYPFDPNGAPEFSRMRHATQYASSIDGWCEMMKKNNNGGYANAWLIGDINTNEIARLELGLKYVGFEKKKDGYFLGSNVAENLNILRFETKSEETNIKLSSVARRVRWKQLMKENAGKINIELAKAMEADHYDTFLKINNPGTRSICGHWELDPQTSTTSKPFEPGGTVDGKVVDSKMAKKMSFLARWGSACGTAFDAKIFLDEHPQFDWMTGLLKDRPSQPWTEFKAGER
ncbi:MAG: C45 family autoproteolytic acyltransferase/hydrolase [Bacteroidota bacterium]